VRRRLASLGVAWLVAAAVLRVTMLAPEQCPPFAATDARAAAVAAIDWVAANQRADGRYLYEYQRRTGAASGAYNLVRHAATTMAVYQLVAAGETRYLEAADRGLGYMLERMVPTGEGAAGWAEPGDDIQLGAVALLAKALLVRREATGETGYDGELRAVGRFMVGQQQDDGVMLESWLAGSAAADPTRRSRYATGEALWALASLHDVFPGQGWDVAAWRTLDYLSLRRDDEERLFPNPWPDQWAAYSLGQMATWGLADHHIAYARRLAAAFGVQVRWDAQRGGGIASMTHPPEPRGAGFGTVLEGLGSLGILASHDERLSDLDTVLAERLVCGAARLAAAQTGGSDTVGDDPLREVGAWFRNDVTRMDDQQHAASGMLLAEAVLAGVER